MCRHATPGYMKLNRQGGRHFLARSLFTSFETNFCKTIALVDSFEGKRDIPLIYQRWTKGRSQKPMLLRQVSLIREISSCLRCHMQYLQGKAFHRFAWISNPYLDTQNWFFLERLSPSGSPSRPPFNKNTNMSEPGKTQLFFLRQYVTLNIFMAYQHSPPIMGGMCNNSILVQKTQYIANVKKIVQCRNPCCSNFSQELSSACILHTQLCLCSSTFPQPPIDSSGDTRAIIALDRKLPHFSLAPFFLKTTYILYLISPSEIAKKIYIQSRFT